MGATRVREARPGRLLSAPSTVVSLCCRRAGHPWLRGSGGRRGRRSPRLMPACRLAPPLLWPRGDEAPKILAFKEALGLGDEEAAPVFIEVRRGHAGAAAGEAAGGRRGAGARQAVAQRRRGPGARGFVSGSGRRAARRPWARADRAPLRLPPRRLAAA
jgi:hypothetical protein